MVGGVSFDGWERLSGTELAIVRLIEKGWTNPQIAEELSISVNTVKTHLKNVFLKLGVKTRSELAARAAGRASTSEERNHPYG